MHIDPAMPVVKTGLLYSPQTFRKLANFLAPTFVMRDPFVAPVPGAAGAGRAPFLVLGGVCVGCSQVRNTPIPPNLSIS